MRTVKRFTQGLVMAGLVMGLALNAAAAPGGGPGKGPRGERPAAGAEHQHARSERGERREGREQGARGDRGKHGERGDRGKGPRPEGLRPQVSVFEVLAAEEEAS
ncbi:MAG: hypothetical protein ACO2YV_05005 [Pseudomonadales bacterium]|jgi:hypothetical protein